MRLRTGTNGPMAKDIPSNRIGRGQGRAAQYSSIKITLRLGNIFSTVCNDHTGHQCRYLSFSILHLSSPIPIKWPFILLQFHNLPITSSSAYPYFSKQLVVVQEGGEGRMWDMEVLQSQCLAWWGHIRRGEGGVVLTIVVVQTRILSILHLFGWIQTTMATHAVYPIKIFACAFPGWHHQKWELCLK